LEAKILPERPMEDLGEEPAGVSRNGGTQLKTAGDDGLNNSDLRTYEKVLVNLRFIADRIWFG
jgi:hypothetical protein